MSCVIGGLCLHYGDVLMGAIASQITSLAIVYSTVYSDADQRKFQSSASLAFVWGIHRGPVNSPHKWPVTRKMFPFDDVIMGPCQGDDRDHAFKTTWCKIHLNVTLSETNCWKSSVMQPIRTVSNMPLTCSFSNFPFSCIKIFEAWLCMLWITSIFYSLLIF